MSELNKVNTVKFVVDEYLGFRSFIERLYSINFGTVQTAKIYSLSGFLKTLVPTKKTHHSSGATINTLIPPKFLIEDEKVVLRSSLFFNNMDNSDVVDFVIDSYNAITDSKPVLLFDHNLYEETPNTNISIKNKNEWLTININCIYNKESNKYLNNLRMEIDLPKIYSETSLDYLVNKRIITPINKDIDKYLHIFEPKDVDGYGWLSPKELKTLNNKKKNIEKLLCDIKNKKEQLRYQNKINPDEDYKKIKKKLNEKEEDLYFENMLLSIFQKRGIKRPIKHIFLDGNDNPIKTKEIPFSYINK